MSDVTLVPNFERAIPLPFWGALWLWAMGLK